MPTDVEVTTLDTHWRVSGSTRVCVCVCKSHLGKSWLSISPSSAPPSTRHIALHLRCVQRENVSHQFSVIFRLNDMFRLDGAPSSATASEVRLMSSGVCMCVCVCVCVLGCKPVEQWCVETAWTKLYYLQNFSLKSCWLFVDDTVLLSVLANSIWAWKLKKKILLFSVLNITELRHTWGETLKTGNNSLCD